MFPRLTKPLEEMCPPLIIILAYLAPQTQLLFRRQETFRQNVLARLLAQV